MTDTDETPGVYASSPCFAHELESTRDGYTVTDPQTAIDVARWRKAERTRLLAERRAFSRDHLIRTAATITEKLDRLIGSQQDLAISVYWPIKGELDLRPWMQALSARSITVLLPVILEKGTPIRFHRWTPGCRMVAGFWNIPVPEEGEELVPDICIVPLVGYDGQNYRLGYGGGYFDRTLASLSPAPMTYGIGHVSSALPTIFPQPHDIPMDRIVTA
ncbi:MAG: 5-formyltetrahydrofolate cyclo-ligase [Alphaproteobacteria bacterium]